LSLKIDVKKMILSFIFLTLGYLIGAIPTGWLLARKAGVHDITQHGSGNIGATNVARILGAPYFFMVLFCDGAKAYLYLQLLRVVQGSDMTLMLGAVALLMGNGISCFLQAKGGKGVATSLGILLALQNWLLLPVSIVWALVFFMTKNMGISCAAGFLSLPLLVLYEVPGDINLFFLTIFMCCWGLWRHEANIRKFFSGNKVLA
jgi:acyl phosphate:glycerol-3-phosphate acyltransferase